MTLRFSTDFGAKVSSWLVFILDVCFLSILHMTRSAQRVLVGMDMSMRVLTSFQTHVCVCVVSVFGYPLQVFPCPSNSAGPVVMPYFSVVQEVSKHFAALMLIHCS